MILDIGGLSLQFDESWEWVHPFEEHPIYVEAFRKMQGFRSADVVGIRRADRTVVIVEVKDFRRAEELSVQDMQQKHAQKVVTQIRDTLLALHLLPRLPKELKADAPVEELRTGVLRAVEGQSELLAVWAFSLWKMDTNREKRYIRALRESLKAGLLYCGTEVRLVVPEFSEVPGLHMIRKEAA
jgi:hypothetical protein